MSTISFTNIENMLGQSRSITVGADLAIGARTMWFHYDQVANTLTDSSNVASQTDSSAGKWDINLTTAASAVTDRLLACNTQNSSWVRTQNSGSCDTSETASVTKWNSSTSTPTDADYPHNRGQMLGDLA